jgi:hypothetical protein
MRKVLIAAGLLACLGMAACQKSVSEASADPAAADAPKKLLGRSAQMYQGQGQVQSVQSATVEPSKDGGVILKAQATVAGAGYTNPGFLPRIYAASPDDGIYSVDVVADQPKTPGAATPTPLEAKGEWNRFTDGRIKGIRFISKTNEVVAMLPAGAAKAAK